MLGGCSATGLIDCEGYYTYNPDDFSEEEQGWINESAQRWNVWVGHVVVTTSPGKRAACSIHDGVTANPDKIGQDHHPTESITIDKEHLKRINQLNRVRFESVVMHEVGHSLGYGHILGGPALMAPASADDFTELDRIECIKHGMCKMTRAGQLPASGM